MVGRQLVFGLRGPDVTDADLRLFEETRAGGLILYRRNFAGPERLHALLERLEGALGRRLLVTTDHEGGRIIMLGTGVTIFPDNLAAGTAGEVAFVKRQGLIEGKELRRLGVDVSFGPVLDVLTDRYSPNIGIRSYGKDPELVGRFGAARIEGLQSAGVSACAKHFPGKGHAPVDAHLGLPVIDSDWSEMHAVHLTPFMAAMEAGVDCLMTSHPLYPNLDPSPRTPATFSRLIVEDYLRGEVGYRGVVASDDLEMGAIGDLCPIGEATVRAAAAGHDLLLVCHTEAAQRAAHRALLDAYRSRALPVRALERSVARLDTLAARRPTRFDGGSPRAERDGEPLAKAIAARAVTVMAPPLARLPAEVERPRPRRLPAPVRPGRPHHRRGGHAGRGALCARGDGALRDRARGGRGRRRARGSGDRRRSRSGRRRRRLDPLSVRRAPPCLQPRAPRSPPGRGPHARRRAHAGPL